MARSSLLLLHPVRKNSYLNRMKYTSVLLQRLSYRIADVKEYNYFESKYSIIRW